MTIFDSSHLITVWDSLDWCNGQTWLELEVPTIAPHTLIPITHVGNTSWFVCFATFCRFLPQVTKLIRPCLPLLSLLTTSCCIGSPLAVNIKAIRSPFGLEILLPVVAFHTAAFVAGYKVTEAVFPNAPDLPALAKTISFETGKLQWVHQSLFCTLYPVISCC